MKNIVLIGSGNVATHLGEALVGAGVVVTQVWSRTVDNAQLLAGKIGSEAVSDLALIRDDADAYIFSLVDDALGQVLELFPHKDKVLIHTAGSLSLDVLREYSAHCGVMYPLQTFSKSKSMSLSDVRILIEASDVGLLDRVRVLASRLSSRVSDASSEQRKYLHVAAVFACNFTNHLYSLAEDVLVQNGLDFNLVRPLILETAQKALLHSPHDVQTGPAVRGDQKIVDSHLELLNGDADLQKLYRDLSARIMGEPRF